MRKLLAGIGAAIGGFALVRWFTRERAQEAVAEPDGRADELRAKLAESRAIVEERDEFEGAELTVDQAEPGPPNAPEDRRRHVHERARAAAERMRAAEPDE